MKRHEDLPVAPPALRAVTAPATGNEDDREPVALPVAAPPAGPGSAITIPVAERAMSAVANAARELWLHPDRLVHVIIHGEAETMAEHRAYVESRGWVPAGMSEAAEKAVTIAGLIHYLIVARSLKASMKAVKFAAGKVDHAADRAVSFYIAAIVTALVVLLSVYL